MKNNVLFLRDASILMDQGENDFIRRFRKAVLAAKQNGLNLQITLNEDLVLESDTQILKQMVTECLSFEHVLIHLHTSYSNKFGVNDFTMKTRDFVHHLIRECSNIDGLCVHPDLVDDMAVLQEFVVDNVYMGVEVLGKNATTGNRPSDITTILEQHDFLSVVLDTAHIQEMEMERAGEPDLTTYIDAFQKKIAEVHVSLFGNFYDQNLPSCRFSTDHSLLTCAPSLEMDLLPTIKRLTGVNIVIEGVVPDGPLGCKLLKREVGLFKEAFSSL